MGKDTGQKPIGEAYDTGDEIVVLGTPPDFDDSVPEDDPRRHNCDAMGCGCAHVLYRFHKPNSGVHPSGGASTTVGGATRCSRPE